MCPLLTFTEEFLICSQLFGILRPRRPKVQVLYLQRRSRLRARLKVEDGDGVMQSTRSGITTMRSSVTTRVTTSRYRISKALL